MKFALDVRKRMKNFSEFKKTLITLLEIFLIAAWAVWVGRELLKFDENWIPWGR